MEILGQLSNFEQNQSWRPHSILQSQEALLSETSCTLWEWKGNTPYGRRKTIFALKNNIMVKLPSLPTGKTDFNRFQDQNRKLAWFFGKQKVQKEVQPERSIRAITPSSGTWMGRCSCDRHSSSWVVFSRW